MCASRTLFIVRCPLRKLPSSEDPGPKQSTPNNVTPKTDGDTDADVSEEADICSKIEEIINRLHVHWSTWLKSSCGQYTEIHFCCNEGIGSEKMIEELSSVGIGKVEGSCILVLPVSYATRDPRQSSRKKRLMFQTDTNTTIDGAFAGGSSRREFIKSIRSRLTVPQVFHTISASAQITFDYVSLVILASLIAAFGLGSNSSVVIVASMLISPLMGPILAMVFALTIWDVSLLSLGIKSEMLGISLSLIVGMFYGMVTGATQMRANVTSNFPTKEMCDRGQVSSLITGVFVALPSGAGVAISVLGGNIGSLVGVAISASLLPPAVNCGIFIGLSLITYFSTSRRPDNQYRVSLCGANASLYQNMRNSPLSRQLAGLGGISLLLTMLNIFCILLTGILVLKIKQVTKRNTFADKFWDDLKASKSVFAPGKRKESGIRMECIQEWAGHYGLDVDAERDRNVTSNDVRRRVKLFAHDISQINSDLNMITNNVYRYGPTQRVDSIFEEMLPSLPPKWTEIFKDENNRASSRFEVVPAESDEEAWSSHSSY